MLDDTQRKLCDDNTTDFSDLKALTINCTLKPSPGGSHTDKLLGVAEAILVRNEVAVLATADAAGGNVGCPMTTPERAHFIGTLKETSRNMTAADIKVISDALHEYARETIGDRADAE